MKNNLVECAEKIIQRGFTGDYVNGYFVKKNYTLNRFGVPLEYAALHKDENGVWYTSFVEFAK
jgi:hypothetical protein